ncbi:MAG TPA: pyridoxamine 5'-phosphate oxidase family protein [Thermotogota bacterium]|nr:pyridoxamine 5'-phosphate oxidase family protein [Thermotogota bacterium]HRW93695.1 pyridoxamine 5'-phosphate oxidase family protein [Thermotogota bacterium]
MIRKEGKVVSFSVGETTHSVTIHDLPQEFFDWQVQTRLKGLKIFSGEEKGMPNFSAHSVVMNTIAHGKEYPINSCIKGLGMVPKTERLPELGERAMDMIRRSYEVGPEKTFQERLQFLKDLYSDPDGFDREIMSSMEMFQTRTYENARNDPRVNLLFYDHSSGYSVMFDSIAEFVARDDPFYRYVAAIHDLFHLPKDPAIRTDRYEWAYRFYQVSAVDKTPGPNASKVIF